MYPELFDFSLPDFLANLFGVHKAVVYTYTTSIAVGTLIAVIYTKWRTKKELNGLDLSNTFFYAFLLLVL
ncbi:MAG: hypothetical protein QNK89_01125 [Lacinutrix sp.]|uniref:hypothetical protein n=1 Tax=Lacinutrix sp. TaxID=1937692 RepID=UPI0030AF2C7E